MRSSIRPFRPLLLLALLALVLSACGQNGGTTGGAATSAPAGAATTAPAAGGGAQGTIKVGSKDFTEEFIVAEMYAQLLENAGFTVEKKLNLGGTPIADTALKNGEIDLYPEYTSTGLLEVLKKEPIKD